MRDRCVSRINIAQGVGTRASVIIWYLFARCLSSAGLSTRILMLAEDKARAVNGCVSCEWLTPCRHCRLTRGLRELSLLSCNNPPALFPSFFPAIRTRNLVGHEEREFAQHMCRRVTRAESVRYTRLSEYLGLSNIF